MSYDTCHINTTNLFMLTLPPFRNHFTLNKNSSKNVKFIFSLFLKSHYVLILISLKLQHVLQIQETVQVDDEPYVPRKEVNTALASPTKNVAGPAVYYPPGKELFAKSEAQAAWRGKVCDQKITRHSKNEINKLQSFALETFTVIK